MMVYKKRIVHNIVVGLCLFSVDVEGTSAGANPIGIGQLRVVIAVVTWITTLETSTPVIVCGLRVGTIEECPSFKAILGIVPDFAVVVAETAWLVGVVVKRVPEADGYERFEPRLLERLLEVRQRMIEADLGEGIETAYWSAAQDRV